MRSRFYVKIMPPYLPWHLELVYLSGVAEIVLAVLVLIPKWTSLAAWGTHRTTGGRVSREYSHGGE